MDFTLSEEQQAIGELAGQILGDKLPAERIREIELDPDGRWFADDVWLELAKANLLGIALPEVVGGSGFGFLEACLILEQQGRTVAPLPLLPTLVLGALPIAQFGSDAQRQHWLPGVVDGTTILTGAITEAGSYVTPDVLATTATVAGDGWRLDGEKELVPAAHLAAAVLVPARVGEQGSAVFIVDPAAEGVTLERNVAITDEPQFTLRLSGVQVGADAVLGTVGQGDEIVDWIADRATAALCSIQTGVCDGALAITAAYVSEREQFGSKIASFQAVAQRLADAYIDTQAIRLSALQAAWRLSESLPADDEVDIAKFWASDGGHRVSHAVQHVHGGIGVDLDYPIHRYYRWLKVTEFNLGSATEHLRRLGQRLASEPV